MNDEEVSFKHQEQFGRVYNEDDFLVFNVAVLNPETIAYLVDFYVYTSRCYPGEPPNHIGFSYILPSTLQSSVGLLTVPITSTKHRPIGQLTVEYVAIKPIADQSWNMSISYAKHWEERWSGLDVGHRGLGTSFKLEMQNCANVRENTIASLKTAAYHGADMVEFDVQLSKDLIPVIYHDFHVSISLKRKKQIEAMDMLEIPVKDLTLEQLHLLKDGTFELNHPFDLNVYLDIIIKVVLDYGCDRKIIFSSFNPDICAMIRLKQNKYPVVFLTQGETIKYPTYHDPRCQTIPMAMRHALAADILGINVHTEDILRDPSQVKLVKDSGLIIFCWGDDNNDKDTIKHLKKLGLHGVIYDKMDEFNPKSVKESIFLVDARESQKALIALAHSSQATSPQQPPIPLPINTEQDDYYLALEKAQNLVTSTSTATSLESLGKSVIGNDSVYPLPIIQISNGCNSQQDKEMGDLTKTFSVCAKSFGHPPKAKNVADTAMSEICVEDDSGKNSL
ncbi:glycerophosphocholine phosphodiesterase GPCPD1-like [Belonocnema kinseyi]|uniref:glycerophosphocholine phosphodiesterase GPCPD1-like n=1 Tax=Belonocnema kinseyi TaxID=2817044 RepID=UPI00143D0CCD|nr:glycerophosphocholine phosphodiesterase GPCPD1-like [Belonocnema kinseyi]